MITIDGIGTNCLSMMWVPASSTLSPCGAYCSKNRMVSPVTPTSMFLPPVSGPSIWFDTRATGYGGRFTSVEVGTLASISSVERYPKPCQHSKIDASLIYRGSDGTLYPRLKSQVIRDPASIPYTRDGVRLSYVAGKPMASTDAKTYNHLGELVTLTKTIENQLLWNTNSFFLPDVEPSDISSVTRPYGFFRHDDEVWQAKVNPLFLAANSMYRVKWTRMSANVWIEEWWQEYHHNASYVPQFPVAPSGLGYFVSWMKRTITHTLTHVQQATPGYFRGMFTMHEVSVYRQQYPFPAAGTVTADSSATVVLLPCYPGLTAGAASIDVSFLNRYCDAASERAKILFSSSSQKIARSTAIADVQALDSNWIENLSQVRGTLGVITPLIQGAVAVRTGNISEARRALAGAYLSYMYVVRPAISDAKDLRKNLGQTTLNISKNRFSNERRRGAFHEESPTLDVVASIDYFCTYHLQLKDNNFAVVWNALERLGLDPSAGQLWDLIPLSFVIDWFIKVGPALRRISAYLDGALLRHVKHRVQTFKVQWPISVVSMRGLMDLTSYYTVGTPSYTWYDRRVDNSIGSIDPFAGQSSTGLSVSQMTQGAALLSSYKR